ncbi:MAG TPA: aminotransferase, partial [Chryseosolibacter sp.]|nr:aminotransferase [Chryseosolibacter sp.]
MRQKLLSEGAKELSYEIRGIVKKAEELKTLGVEISWENIGDPIQKHHKLPAWIKEIVADLVSQDDVYSYCPSKGMLET